MSEPEWLTAEIVVAIHDEQLTIHGGSAGLRDATLLESALGRPRNKWAYENAGLAELAASYGFGIARNHPFVDGNKRTTLLAIYTFLGLNGIDFIVAESEAAAIVFSLAAGEVSEESLARWIRDNWPKQGRKKTAMPKQRKKAAAKAKKRTAKRK
jgi:death-on-curing protein